MMVSPQQAPYSLTAISLTPRSLSIGRHHPHFSLARTTGGRQAQAPGPTSVCTRLTLWARSSRTQLKMSTTPSFSAMSSMVSMAMKQPVLPAPALQERTGSVSGTVEWDQPWEAPHTQPCHQEPCRGVRCRSQNSF